VPRLEFQLTVPVFNKTLGVLDPVASDIGIKYTYRLKQFFQLYWLLWKLILVLGEEHKLQTFGNKATWKYLHIQRMKSGQFRMLLHKTNRLIHINHAVVKTVKSERACYPNFRDGNAYKILGMKLHVKWPFGRSFRAVPREVGFEDGRRMRQTQNRPTVASGMTESKGSTARELVGLLALLCENSELEWITKEIRRHG
jgi:hypothetical protein